MLGKLEKVMYSLAKEMEYQFAESLRANYNFLLSYNCEISVRRMGSGETGYNEDHRRSWTTVQKC